ncbi:MAG: four helix bundle protein [Candidatus Marinimicrobia bacterium]|nr:four helix bundle protein [Candidatus Neomarinimicrobiota bacterium]
MTKVSTFEELRIWQEARLLAKDIYIANSSEQSKGAKDWGFRNQIQTAVVSITNNIAEGFERSSDKDFARFLDIAKASCGEARSMLYLAEDLNYIAVNKALELRNKSISISKGISTLTKHLRKQPEI